MKLNPGDLGVTHNEIVDSLSDEIVDLKQVVNRLQAQNDKMRAAINLTLDSLYGARKVDLKAVLRRALNP